MTSLVAIDTKDGTFTRYQRGPANRAILSERLELPVEWGKFMRGECAFDIQSIECFRAYRPSAMAVGPKGAA